MMKQHVWWWWRSTPSHQHKLLLLLVVILMSSSLVDAQNRLDEAFGAGTPCSQPLGSTGAGNAALSSGFFQCCDCTFAFRTINDLTALPACTSTATQLGLLFAGDSGVSGRNNTLRFYAYSGTPSYSYGAELCQLGVCQNFTNFNYIGFDDTLVVGVKKGALFSLYVVSLSSLVLTPPTPVSITVGGGGCILQKDDVNQGSRIAADASQIGCTSYSLDAVSYFNVALDSNEVYLLALANWARCAYEVSRGSWLFDSGTSFPSPPLATTPAALLNMNWDNPCVNTSASISSLDIGTTPIACPYSFSATPLIFPTSGGQMNISVGSVAIDGATMGSVAVSTPFGVCTVTSFPGTYLLCTIPSGINSSVSLDFKVFSGNIIHTVTTYSYYPPSVNTVTNAPYEGGNITIDGINFGALSSYVNIVIAGNTYPCTVTIAHLQLSCSVPDPISIGASGPVSFTLNVGNQANTSTYIYVSPSPSVTPTVSISATRSASRTPSETRTPTPSVTVTRTPTRSASETRTPTPSVTVTKTPTRSVSETRTPTPSSSATATISITASATGTISNTASVSPTISNTASVTPTISVTSSVSPTHSLTRTITPTTSRTASNSATISISASVTPSTSPAAPPPPPPPPPSSNGPILATCDNGKVCDDNDPCTVDVCLDSGCMFSSVVCDDADPCTEDSCNAQSGECEFQVIDSSCGEIARQCSDYTSCGECDTSSSECGWVVCDADRDFSNVTGILLNNKTKTSLIYSTQASLARDLQKYLTTFKIGDMEVSIYDQESLARFGQAISLNGKCVPKQFTKLEKGCQLDTGCDLAANLLADKGATIGASVGVAGAVTGGSMGIFVIGLLFYRRKKVPAEVVVADSFSNRSRRRTRSLKLNPGELFITSENKAYIGRSASANPLYSK